MDSIIFDVDGTLWDATYVILDSWNEVIAEEHARPEPVAFDELRALFGKTLWEISDILFPHLPESPRRALMDRCCRREEEWLYKKSSPIFPEIDTVIKTLYKKYPLFIVSNCQAGYIEAFLATTGLEPYIKDHLCPGDTGNGKADNIKEIIARHDLKAPVYVGDTMGDYTATKQAGKIPFIFAAYGFGDVPNPDHVIHQPIDLLDLC